MSEYNKDCVYCVSITSKQNPLTHFRYLVWTTEPPMQDGWYYSIKGDFPGSVDLVQVVMFPDPDTDRLAIVHVYNDSDLYTLHDFTHWLGPLPVPEPPK